MKIHKFTFNPFMENTYVIQKDDLGIIVDPGMYHDHERDEMEAFVKDQQIQLKAIVNTHCHIDHVFGIKWCMEYFNIPFYTHKKEADNLVHARQRAAWFGILLEHDIPSPTAWFNDLELPVGDFNLSMLFVPGHSPGHVALYSQEEHWIIGGDVVFKDGGVGRTDLPGGDLTRLEKSIREEILTLPDKTVIYPGHGEYTTVQNEKRLNPWV